MDSDYPRIKSIVLNGLFFTLSFRDRFNNPPSFDFTKRPAFNDPDLIPNLTSVLRVMGHILGMGLDKLTVGTMFGVSFHQYHGGFIHLVADYGPRKTPS
jgi:hypothetical protein